MKYWIGYKDVKGIARDTLLFVIENSEELVEFINIRKSIKESFPKTKCRFLVVLPNSDYNLENSEDIETFELDKPFKDFKFYSHYGNDNPKSITIKIIADNEIESNKIQHAGAGIDEVILSKKWIDYDGCQDLNLIIWAAKSRCGKIIYI